MDASVLEIDIHDLDKKDNMIPETICETKETEEVEPISSLDERPRMSIERPFDNEENRNEANPTPLRHAKTANYLERKLQEIHEENLKSIGADVDLRKSDSEGSDMIILDREEVVEQMREEITIPDDNEPNGEMMILNREEFEESIRKAKLELQSLREKIKEDKAEVSVPAAFEPMKEEVVMPEDPVPKFNQNLVTDEQAQAQAQAQEEQMKGESEEKIEKLEKMKEEEELQEAEPELNEENMNNDEIGPVEDLEDVIGKDNTLEISGLVHEDDKPEPIEEMLFSKVLGSERKSMPMNPRTIDRGQNSYMKLSAGRKSLAGNIPTTKKVAGAPVSTSNTTTPQASTKKRKFDAVQQNIQQISSTVSQELKKVKRSDTPQPFANSRSGSQVRQIQTPDLKRSNVVNKPSGVKSEFYAKHMKENIPNEPNQGSANKKTEQNNNAMKISSLKPIRACVFCGGMFDKKADSKTLSCLHRAHNECYVSMEKKKKANCLMCNSNTSFVDLKQVFQGTQRTAGVKL